MCVFACGPDLCVFVCQLVLTSVFFPLVLVADESNVGSLVSNQTGESHKYTQTHTHTHKHTHTHTHVNTHTQTHTHTAHYTIACAHIHTHAQNPIQLRINKHKHLKNKLNNIKKSVKTSQDLILLLKLI